MRALELDAERYTALEKDPRLLTRPAEDCFAVRNGLAISCAEFLGDVMACADALPDASFVINLCTDRYRFTTAFFAAAIRGQTTLLPSQRSAEFIDRLRQQYSACRVIADDADASSDYLVNFAPGQNGAHAELTIDPEHVAAIAFTSGSTGTPEAHAKSWQQLISGRATHARYLTRSIEAQDIGTIRNTQGQPNGLVATVPSWHMYGLEWAMLLPTIAPLSLYCGADFFPSDVTTALNSFGAQSNNVLVSTPVHLRALLKSQPPTSQVLQTVCATAPIDKPTAVASQEHLNTCLFEIYGCSELGSLATRLPARDQGWEFFDTFKLTLANNELSVSTPLLPQPITLADRFGTLKSSADEQRFELLGRAADLVKVAGKRESLANLNSVLLSLPGVVDGVVYQPQALGVAGGERLAAFVVGESLNVAELRVALASRLESIFVPRPIRIVDTLPRDTTSKLKMAALKTLAESFSNE